VLDPGSKVGWGVFAFELRRVLPGIDRELEYVPSTL